ncbi:hypothetical protein ACFL1I_04770 [Candidatus Omnitrophota bacterium]
MKRAKRIYDPYAEIIDQFNRVGVKYVVVGMSGINYYASRAADAFATQDFDIFVKPTLNNIKKSVSVLKKFDYSIISNEREASDSLLKDITRSRKTIIATNSYEITFKFILAVSGYTFSQMEQDATVFDIGGIPVKVAKLSKLLMSKKIAGRKKDKLFLKRFELLLQDKKRLK